MLKARLESHREAEIPVFVANAALKRQISEGKVRAYQRAIGRMNEDGTYVKGWRP